MESVLTYLIPFTIGIIMFGIGLNLSPTDFKRVFVRPKGILFGLFGQLVLMPAFGFLVAYLAPIDPVFKLGIILITACPGGTSSNLITYLLQGRVALSVSITAFNSFLIIFTIPIILELGTYLFLGENQDVSLSVYQTFYEIAITVIIPVLTGMLFHQYFRKTTLSIKPYLRYILPFLLLIMFSLVLYSENQNESTQSINYNMELLIPALLINVGVMLIGYYSSGWVGIKHTGKFTIAIEMGLQNTALAIFIATNLLYLDGLSTIAVLYGSFSFFTTFIIAYIMNRFGRKDELE
ncbi:MAG: bile acid:sodium symporter family protein [Crocinitomicaceae bacterium]|nr:bile acid:sodium symporter family protein [Crocinitomicaceae bacterium]